MTGRASILAAVAIATALAACSPGVAPSAPARTLDGHTYVSTAIQGANLVPGTQVRLTFADGNLNASGGCNMMGGTYSIQGDRLITSQTFMTEMACDDARQRQDDWLARFLGNVTARLDGDTLTLTDGTIRLTLVDKEVATPDQPLEGTGWVLEGIESGDGVSSMPAGVTASLIIEGGRLHLKSGCNTGGASVQVSATTGLRRRGHFGRGDSRGTIQDFDFGLELQTGSGPASHSVLNRPAPWIEVSRSSPLPVLVKPCASPGGLTTM
jgi:heat shock protein HslJ